MDQYKIPTSSGVSVVILQGGHKSNIIITSIEKLRFSLDKGSNNFKKKFELYVKGITHSRVPENCLIHVSSIRFVMDDGVVITYPIYDEIKAEYKKPIIIAMGRRDNDGHGEKADDLARER